MHTIKTYNFKQLPLEIEIKDLSFIKRSPQLLGKPHQTSFYQLIWLTNGSMTLKVDFREITIHKHHLLLLSCGQVCQFDISSDYTGYLILFTPLFFAESETDTYFLYTSEILNPLSPNQAIPVDKTAMDPLIASLKKELDNTQDSFQSYIARNYLRIILFTMERQCLSHYKLQAGQNIRSFINAVELHYQEQRTVAFYARLLHTSEKSLTALTQQTIAKTPKQYIDSRIILEAKRHLAYSEKSVKEIGFILGFDEPTNFNKYFKKHTNHTPLQFKASL